MEALIDRHNKALNEHVLIYLSQMHSNREEVNDSFYKAEKEWKRYCKKINSTEKSIHLNKNAFRVNVDLSIKKLKENELQN